METKILPPSPENLALAGELIRQGGLVAMHTETVYGLAANALDGDAVAGIFAVKGRPQDNPLIVHIASKNDVYHLVRAFPDHAEKLCAAFWPGPLTLALPRSDAVSGRVVCGQDTVALRMPNSPVALGVIRAAGVPLAAPSANISGRPSPTTAAHVMQDLGGKIPLIIDGGSCQVGVESTVISIYDDKIRILRPGAVTAGQIAACTEIMPELDHAVLAALPEGAQTASPGMKYRHYAPKAELTLVGGGLAEFISYVENLDEDIWVMCFDGEGDVIGRPYVEYGAANDPAGQCRKLFDALRRLDELGAGRVLVRAPDRAGAGLAVYNRLLRAAGFRFIQN